MKPDLSDARLYAILDLGYVERDRISQTAELLGRSGAGIVQLRAKGFSQQEAEEMAIEVAPILRHAGVPFIVNDFPEIAGRVGADGFHLGQDDGDREDALHRYQSAAASAGQTVAHPIVGRSTHSVDQAVAAAEERFDYIGFGPLYTTPTKPGRPGIGIEEIATVHQLVDLPIFCIGGVKVNGLTELVAAGARRVVIVSGLLEAGDAIPERAAEILAALEPVT